MSGGERIFSNYKRKRLLIKTGAEIFPNSGEKGRIARHRITYTDFKVFIVR